MTNVVPLSEADRDVDPADLAAVRSAMRTIGTEVAGLRQLRRLLGNGLGKSFAEAVRLIRGRTGRVVVTGVGKSGHIGNKLAATLASTGTPALFVHACEASHGDLGMITAEDVVLALSWSGETREMAAIVSYAKRFSVPILALTARPNSALGRNADVVIRLPAAAEACPHGLAPTTSAMLQMAVGDALAVALLEARGFTAQDFGIFHPGGRLGASLQFVRDIMHGGEALPVAPLATPMSEAIVLISQKGFGCLGILDGDGDLVGIITDGDLRRHLDGDLLTRPVDDVMSRAPKTIAPDAVVGAALQTLNSAKISALFVVEGRRPVGIVHMHDLLRAGVA